MSGKINTTDIKGPGAGIPKLLQPGNTVCTITAVELEPFKFKEGAVHIVLHLEGPDQGKDFEGFFIDKNNESLGRHKGQVGRVNAGQWAFADGTTKSGIKVSKDQDILVFIKTLCTALGITKWLIDQNNKHETVESLVKAFGTEKPFLNKPLEYCICGKEYLSKTGHTNYELFLPKFSKTATPFSNAAPDRKVIKFNAEDHIIKKKVENVSEFGNADTGISGPASADFELS